MRVAQQKGLRNSLQKLLTEHRSISIILLIAVAVAFRILLIQKTTGDAIDFYIPWFNYIHDNGFASLSGPIPNKFGLYLGNYSPSFYYLLYIASFFDGWLPTIVLIKLCTLPFDLLASWLMFRIVLHLGHTQSTAIWAAIITFAAPITIANSSWWGQCDMMYSSLLLWAILAALENKPKQIAIATGCSLAFKALAVFFFPMLVILWLGRRLKLQHCLLIPFTFALFMVPAYLAGRPYQELMGIYQSQFGTFKALSLNAPNFWGLIPNQNYQIGTILGLILTSFAFVSLALYVFKSKLELSKNNIILLSLLCLTAAPFLLPKMHDRYFFAANLLSIVLIFSHSKLLFVPVGLQLASLAAYIPYLLGVQKVPFGQQGVFILLYLGASLVGISLYLLIKQITHSTTTNSNIYHTSASQSIC